MLCYLNHTQPYQECNVHKDQSSSGLFLNTMSCLMPFNLEHCVINSSLISLDLDITMMPMVSVQFSVKIYSRELVNIITNLTDSAELG